MSESLFERLGGQSAVNAAVDIFYRKMLTDERVSHFFDDIDMEQQIHGIWWAQSLQWKKHARRTCSPGQARTK